jgi:hypothetical protein
MAVNDEEGTSKAVSVGATIGGVVGLFAFIALLLMAVRWYMRWKRGNKRKTIKMRQSWYPAGYDGPDHIVPTPIEVSFFHQHVQRAVLINRRTTAEKIEVTILSFR